MRTVFKSHDSGMLALFIFIVKLHAVKSLCKGNKVGLIDLMSFNTDMYKFILTQSRRCFYVNQTKGKIKIDKEIKNKKENIIIACKIFKNKLIS